MISRKTLLAVSLLLLISITPVFADIKLPAVISDNMVLQQQTYAPLWGFADPGEKVTISPSWQWLGSISATADNNGKWSAKLKTPKYGGPYTITFKAANTITIKNILIGEVWVCSGQSNMQMTVKAEHPWHKGVFNWPTEVKNANYPEIRMFTVKRQIAKTPQPDCTGSWQICSPETAGDFSAAGYFFARKLYNQLNIPFGMIHTSWGGTPSEAWTSAEKLKTHPDYAEFIAQMQSPDLENLQAEYENQLTEWNKKRSSADLGNQPQSAVWNKPDLDDSNWETMDLPKPWEQQGHANLDGIVWFRKQVDIPKSWQGKDLALELGPIDDMDITYFNAQKVGSTMESGQWLKKRKYNIPAEAISPEKNIITVRVVDTAGAGGFHGKPEEMFLAPADGSDQPISIAGQWKYKIALDLSEFGPKPKSPGGITNQNSPTALYNAMLHPIIPFAIKGAIWYQGESNAGRAYQYRTLFPLMIKNWRSDWNRGDFPFYFVQIAPFNYGTQYICAELREAQMMTLSLPKTGMAVTMDIGNIKDIHPRNKRLVGERLALWALAKDYGQNQIVYSGPIYTSMHIEDDKIRLYFKNLGSGLMAKTGDLTNFTIAGNDRIFHQAYAEIENNTVVVTSENVKKPVAVRYAWKNTDLPNLYNIENLPASSFRTDNWPGVTYDKK